MMIFLGFVEISYGMKVLLHAGKKTYKDAKEYCRDRNALLLFSVCCVRLSV